MLRYDVFESWLSANARMSSGGCDLRMAGGNLTFQCKPPARMGVDFVDSQSCRPKRLYV